MKEKLIVIGRWIAVLPVSAIGCYLLFLVFRFINHSFNENFGFDIVWNIIVELIAYVLMGGSFVYLGTAVAPSHKRVCACVLFGLACMVAGFCLFVLIMSHFKWVSLLSIVCLLGGAGYSLYSILNDDDFKD
jgi:hypothetical protein